MIIRKNRTNIFLITNLSELSGEYTLFEILGLNSDANDYQNNKQYIIRNLSRELREPIEIIKKEGKSYLVTRNEKSIIELLPTEFPVLQNKVIYFKGTGDIFPLNFNSLIPFDRVICKRFLQFSIQGSIFKNKKVWQPNTGKPFFSKIAIHRKGVDIFPGFNVRVVDLKQKGWGVAIDATRKYLNSNPIPNYVSKQEFDKYYKGRRVVYKLGHQWYEIKLTQWHSLSVSKHKYPFENESGSISLLDDLRQRCSKPHPQLLANLPADSSVLFYHLSNGEERSVPSGLCFLVLGTEDEMDGHLHKNSILCPSTRLNEIHEVREKIISTLVFGGRQINLDRDLLTVTKKKFPFPDICIGDNNIIKYKETYNSPKKFAKIRSEKILNGSSYGFLKPVQPTLGPQYVFLPRSVYDTFKDNFVGRIIDDVNRMYPWFKYSPVVDYFEDDSSQRSNYVRLGKKIISDIKEKHSPEIPSFALVMIPSTIKGKREHDKLAALVIRELKKVNISASIIHSASVNKCYEEKQNINGELFYSVRYSERGKLKGYTQNVALSKVLLNNRKYPFAFESPLNSDLTIGIDVKNNLAGFVYIDKYAKVIRPEFVTTEHKEKLPTRVILKQIYDTIKLEAKTSVLKQITIQRDGRIYDTETKGITIAINKLKEEGVLPVDSSVSIIEIPKSSFLSFRIFDTDVNTQKNGTNALNPEIGSYWILNDKIGYVCTTGKEFLRKGTSKPLMVKLISGIMPFELILQDVFSLSTLTFTKLDDCSRLPFTIKILDILLRGLASNYDQEKLEYLEYSDVEELELLKNELNLKQS